ncbi:MAG: 6-carboxytetrahydropterin synthase QueD [Frankiaceae bacterium]|nr:6-carboxytetrahydropterin synthase QueD [Frankiaceae bacterium]MBV9869364.1 6-carboxytetrahydropterin synthase QueD [Frankiaceae bacterium]
MLISVVRSYRFEAAHKLSWHTGKCARLHGHSYRVDVKVSGPLDQRGVVLDFAEVDEVVEREVVARYDHTFLNDSVGNPTAENLALEIGQHLTAAGLAWQSIHLWETPDGSVVVER